GVFARLAVAVDDRMFGLRADLLGALVVAHVAAGKVAGRPRRRPKSVGPARRQVKRRPGRSVPDPGKPRQADRRGYGTRRSALYFPSCASILPPSPAGTATGVSPATGQSRP